MDPNKIADIIANMTFEDWDRLYTADGTFLADMVRTGIGAQHHGFVAGDPVTIDIGLKEYWAGEERHDGDLVITLDPTEYRRVK